MRESMGREHRTVSRVTTILEATAAAAPRPTNLTALSTLLEAPKSSVHGLVTGLLATGYLQERDGGYMLGPALTLLPPPTEPSVLAHAHRSLEVLEDETRETALLSLHMGGSVVYVDLVESRHSIKYSAPLRVRRPLYPTSSGKCFLAHLPIPQRDAYLMGAITLAEQRRQVAGELDTVAREGVAFNRGETVPEVFAVAAPVLVKTHVVACLSVAGPRDRVEANLDSVAAAVARESRILTAGH
jgi:DNA-binding IclR family transcriptional regulator